MAHVFLDTSALVKHYHPEVGTDIVEQLWNDPESQLAITSLTTVEIISVVAAKVRARTISYQQFVEFQNRFSADVAVIKRLKVFRLRLRHYQDAERILCKHGPMRRLRTLDALQLAAAVHLKSQQLVKRFIAADRDLLNVAALEGFDILDPENP